MKRLASGLANGVPTSGGSRQPGPSPLLAQGVWLVPGGPNLSIRQQQQQQLRLQHHHPSSCSFQIQHQHRTPSKRWASTALPTLPKRSRTAIFFPGESAAYMTMHGIHIDDSRHACFLEVNKSEMREITLQILSANKTSHYTGQGVQKVGMTAPWLEAFPTTARPILQEIDHILRYPLTKIIAEGTNTELSATENAQPAIVATSIMILRILEKDFGFNTIDRVDFTLGHSLGEFAALVAGGYLQHEDSLRMVHKRAQVMAECSRRAREEGGGQYGMVALVCEPDRLEPMIESIHEFLGHSSIGAKVDSSAEVPPIQQVLIANINSKNQIVLSGKIERIKTLLTHLRQFAGHDPRAITLKSETPFHSPLMKPASEFMRRTLDEKPDIVAFPSPIPCISNVSARPFSTRDELKDLLARSCAETVLWAESIRYLDQEEKVRRWIGIGPGQVGRNLVGKEVGMRGRDIVKGGGVWGISDPREIEEIMRALELTEQAAEEEEEE